MPKLAHILRHADRTTMVVASASDVVTMISAELSEDKDLSLAIIMSILGPSNPPDYESVTSSNKETGGTLMDRRKGELVGRVGFVFPHVETGDRRMSWGS